jgi:DNA-binding response OmpR family regulator
MAILIVEDELLLRMDISDDLALHGYEVLQAENADDAIKILETTYEQFSRISAYPAQRTG